MNAPALHPNLLAADLAIEIADEACRVDIECHALLAPSTYPHPVYDTSRIASEITDPEMVESDLQQIARAVRYLDMRGQIVRPFQHMPWIVSFGRA